VVKLNILDNHFFILNSYVKMVCNSNVNGLIVEGEAGIGKTYNIIKALKEEKKEFISISGNLTPLEFYHFLYENKDKTIFIDDSKSIFTSEISLEILKAGLYSIDDKRFINYNTSSSKLRVPNRFEFKGKLIISVNDLSSKQGEDLKAVIDRVLYHKISFSYLEKINILNELVKKEYPSLDPKDREFVFKWIKVNTNEATKNLNFRLLFKLYETYKYDKANFNKLSKELLNIDNDIELLLQVLVDQELSIGDAQKRWCIETGRHRATFYRLKKKIKLKYQNVKCDIAN